MSLATGSPPRITGGDRTGGWLRHQVHLDDFKPEADDPFYQPGEGSLVGQLGAKGGRRRACHDLAVVELRAQRSAGRAAETDLICEWTHLDYASQSVVYGGVSVPGGRGRRRHPESGDPVVAPDGVVQRAGRATVCPAFGTRPRRARYRYGGLALTAVRTIVPAPGTGFCAPS